MGVIERMPSKEERMAKVAVCEGGDSRSSAEAMPFPEQKAVPST